MSETKLLHCPFCGNEVSIYEPVPNAYEPYTGRKYCIFCPGCDLLFGYDEVYGPDFKTREEAAAAWNTRVSERRTSDE